MPRVGVPLELLLLSLSLHSRLTSVDVFPLIAAAKARVYGKRFIG